MTDFATRVLSSKGTSVFSVGQAGFIIKSSNGQLLAIDLYLSNCVERIEGHKGFKRLLPEILDDKSLSFDVVICTHPHLDHFDVDSVPEMISKGSKLLCSVDCEKLVESLNLSYYKEQIQYVQPGDSFEVGDFYVEFVNCDHGVGAPDAVGVIVTVDGKTIYEVGDSCLRLDRTNEIRKTIDVLIAPINGEYGNMNSEDAVRLGEAIHPKIIVPCHYGMFASHGGDLKRFYDLVTKKAMNAVIMQQGEELKF